MKKNNKNSLNICRYCGSNLVVKYGKYRDTQFYWCKSCQRKLRQGNFPFHSKVSASIVCSALIIYFLGESISTIRTYLRKEHGYDPSNSVVVNWIKKYTNLAQAVLKVYKPGVGDHWMIVETKVNKAGKKICLLDVIDSETRFLLSTSMVIEKDLVNLPELIDQAIVTGGKIPLSIKWKNTLLQPDLKGLFHFPNYRPQFNKTLGSGDTNQKNNESFLPQERTEKLFRLRSIKSACQFLEKYSLHYNYFKPNDALGGDVPAKAAGIKNPYRTWANIINNPPKNITTARNLGIS
jgi:hypothetical protein